MVFLQLSFPARDKILTCLTLHPLMRGEDETKKKIIHKAAEFFANQVKMETTVDWEAFTLLDDLKSQLPSSEKDKAMSYWSNLTKALKECSIKPGTLPKSVYSY